MQFLAFRFRIRSGIRDLREFGVNKSSLLFNGLDFECKLMERLDFLDKSVKKSSTGFGICGISCTLSIALRFIARLSVLK